MFFRTRLSRNLSRAAASALCILSVTVLMGCDLSRNTLKMDRSGNMEFQDYRDALAPRLPEPTADRDAADDGDIPALASYIVPPSENLKPMPLVSISVNQTVPLKDVLFELAEQAEYDVELDPRITGSIIFTARDRPFDMVIERIAEIANLRYKFDDDILRVELDTPYHKNYKIDYLSYIRKNTGSITNSVTVSSGGGDTGGPQAGSQFQAATESEANFWGELETNLTQLLGGAMSQGLKTDTDPQVTAVETNPAPVEPIVTTDESGETTVQVQPPEATLQVTSLPPVDSSGQQSGQQAAQAATFSLNKQAGMVTVFGTDREHEKVREYLKVLRRAVTAQVLIEAKVLEVGLSDEFSAGIDWTWENIFGENMAIGFDLVGAALNPPIDPVPVPAADLRAFYASGDFNTGIQALSRFGTVKALASPRLTVLNNQSAVLNVATNQVYFDIDIDVTTEEGVTQTDVDSEIKNVPEGVLINVQPSIDLDNHEISMAVRPTITRITEFVDDPAVQFITAQAGIQDVTSQVPVVNVQELDSVVQLQSGQFIVMGGLMQDRTDATHTGVPVLSEMPVFGGLFRTQVDRVTKTELVIFLKATIIEGSNGSVHDTDRDLYKTFSGDRRPLRM